MYIPPALIGFFLAFFLGLILFRGSTIVGLWIRRRTGRPVYKQMWAAIGVMFWIGMFLLVFI